MPRVRWGIVPVVACALALGGCGSSSDTTPRLPRAQRDALIAQLERARVTATAGDLAGTKAALQAFTRQVARLRRAGDLSDAVAHSLRVGAARALARARSDSDTAAQQPQAPAAPPPAPAAKGKKHEAHGKGRKKGHGQGKRDEGGD